MARGYTPPISEKEKILQRRVEQAVHEARNKGTKSFIGFLSLREQQLSLASLNKLESECFAWGGGRKNAERVMLCVFDSFENEAFPFCCLEIKVQQNRGASPPSHKDYLGSLLALGLQRECFGDIVIDEIHAYVFAGNKIVDFVKQELRTVGRSNVVSVCEVDFPQSEEAEKNKEEQVANVASLRLDAVVSAVCGIPRKNAVSYISKGLVQINHIEITSISYSLYEDDVFSVRGLGKFKLTKIGGKSRKNRLFINYNKY